MKWGDHEFRGLLLKYQFWKKSLRKNATLSSWTIFQHICPHFWAWLLLYSTITPKYVVKVFNSTELHFSEVYFFQNWYFSVKPQNGSKSFQKSTFWAFFIMYWKSHKLDIWTISIFWKFPLVKTAPLKSAGAKDQV